MLLRERVAAEEDHRTADLVQGETVLCRVGEDLLLGAGAPGRVHDAGALQIASSPSSRMLLVKYSAVCD